MRRCSNNARVLESRNPVPEWTRRRDLRGVDHLEAWKKRVGSQVPDPNALVTAAERRRLLEANSAAARFYRRELFRGRRTWARTHLQAGGAHEVLAREAKWWVGYAPDARSRLVDHLRSQRFDLATVQKAGLGVRDPDGRVVDRFRDQLMLPARNEHSTVVGFIGLRQGEGGVYYTRSPDTSIHRRSESLVGLAEQGDLLDGGALPVLVNDPLDALAIERVSRLTGGRWIGVPLCDAVLSAQQAVLLSAHSATDTVVVWIMDPGAARRTVQDFLPELAKTFQRVHAVELSSGHSPASLWLSDGGQQRLHSQLLRTRPLADYRHSRQVRAATTRRIEPPAPDIPEGPSLDL
ncbi:hypothetical protein GCM10009745_72330 [Kribbella yunnanensis]|uniref:DNA primase DNAG catalytic core N-terminal domain-containing protein n=1 Tax=Kribbella yunnanensis TaxID=190194 RepID=A0ABN2IX41_9ACTN